MNTIDQQREKCKKWAKSAGWEWTLSLGQAWEEQERRHADALETVELIDELRAEKGMCIHFLPERSGNPPTQLEVTWIDRQGLFTGKTLLECLRAATEARSSSDE